MSAAAQLLYAQAHDQSRLLPGSGRHICSTQHACNNRLPLQGSSEVDYMQTPYGFFPFYYHKAEQPFPLLVSNQVSQNRSHQVLQFIRVRHVPAAIPPACMEWLCLCLAAVCCCMMVPLRQ